MKPADHDNTTEGFHKLVRGHIPALDGLRGIAILLVLAHGFDIIQTRNGVGRGLELALDLGWIGVQLFFVLSGFLITGILLDTAKSPRYFRNFFLRRTFRIFPLYYAVLFVAFVLVPLFGHPHPTHGDDQLYLWTYTANFAAPLGHGEIAFPHFWSLSVEEQFYVLWPGLVYLVRRNGVFVLGTVLVAVAIVARVLVRARFGPDAAYQFLFCRMDALAIGAMAAALIRTDRIGSRLQLVSPTVLGVIGGIVVLGGAMLGHLLRTGATMQTGGYTILAIGFAIIMVAALAQGWPSRLLSFAPLRRVGMYSYGMYVFYAPLHIYVGLPLLARLDQFAEGNAIGTERGLLYLVIATTITFLVAAASYHVFERPFLRLKDRVAPPVKRAH
ncbi:MAG: acyltransferase [Proteobacteria bacterium]|nr:acyltransferase [Pseudomonadota bacterium]